MAIEIRHIAPDETHAMRQRILRPRQSLAEMDYPGDRAPSSVHLGAFDRERLIGIASIYHEPWPRDPQPDDWRLRGMAVDEMYRGGGVGAALVAACARHLASEQGKRLWCYARTPASAFYERLGLAVRSEIWEGGDIGPHVDMAGDLADILARAQPQLPAGTPGANTAQPR